MLYSWISLDLKNIIFKQNCRKFDYLISIFKMAVGYHGNIILANYCMCILVIYCRCVPLVYGKYMYICHHSKFILGVSEYVSKSQKWPDHTDVQCQNGQTAKRKLRANLGFCPFHIINTKQLRICHIHDHTLFWFIYRKYPGLIPSLLVNPTKHQKSTQHWFNVGPSSTTSAQHWLNIVETSCVCWARSK